MMNVEFLSKFYFCGFASLACVIIAFAGIALLWSPARAIVSNIPAAPCRVVFSRAVDITAFQRAKRKSAFSFSSPAGVVKQIAALGTGKPVMDAFAFWFASRGNNGLLAFRGVCIWFCNYALDDTARTTFVEAFSGTDIGIYYAINLCWGAGKSLMANWARQLCAGIQFFRSPFIRAFAGTSGLSSVFQACCIRFIDFVAGRTLSINQFSHGPIIA